MRQERIEWARPAAAERVRAVTDTAIYKSLREMLDDSGMALIKTVTERYVSWQEFQSLARPKTMGMRATWEITKLMGRASGIEVPIPDIEGRDYWYKLTHEIAEAIATIQCRCREDSSLYQSLHTTQNRSVLVKSRVDETIAAALLDGLDISEEDAEVLLHLDRMPQNANERLIRNTLNVLDDLDALVSVPFSKELFWHLRYLLLEGVDVKRIRVRQARMGLMTSEYQDEQAAAAADKQLEYIAAYLNHSTGEAHDHPVVRALLIPDVFRFYRPLPDSNSEVGRLAFRLYALKAGLPVLGILPLSRAKLDWEDNNLPEAEVPLTPAKYVAAREHDGTDITAWTTLVLQLTLVALGNLVREIHELERRDQELRSLLQRDPLINHRQRSILGRALRDPESEFRIAYHKTTHNVVYATARADLLELADKGYLEMGKNGRAMVFKPRANLREFIEETYGGS